MFPHQYHREQRRAVTAAGKIGYTLTVQKIYGVPPPPPKEYHKDLDNLNTIVHGMQTHSYDMEGLS